VEEIAFVIPAEALTSDATSIDVTATSAAFTSFHWWFAEAQ
jgi:hypothetical protein